MHLDTVFTFCGGDVVTTFKEVADGITCFDLRPEGPGKPFRVSEDPRPIFEVVAEIIGYKKLTIVPTGGSDIRYVLEINGGLAESLGIDLGAELRNPAVEGAAWSCDG